MDLKAAVHQAAQDSLADIVAIRRHLHANPELSFQEHKTCQYVAGRLSDWGIEYRDKVVDTGVVGLIRGRNPESRTIALRADLDALPITEENTVDYKSQNEGVMHACGHDVHTASLLGAARILNQVKDQFDGTIKLIFQPGEERIPGGASLMIEDGVLQNPAPASIIGQHVFPDLEAGKVGFREGMYMASADEIYVTVKGKGGHAALPHKTVDAVNIAANIIVSLQTIVSRNCPPPVPCVLSFGKVQANGATNILPDEVKIEGTFRTMDEAWRAQAHELMVSRAEAIAQSFGGTCEFNVMKGFPYLINDVATTRKAKHAAIDYLGAQNVIDLDLRMTAEDFAYYSQHVPACFYRLGVRNEAQGITSGLHTSTFNIDETALETGMGLMAWLAINELA